MAGNPVFDLLGAEGDDIEALTAYALYKRHKRAWSKDFLAEHGNAPTTADDLAFAKVAATSDQLERYRKDARDILIAFANQTVDDARPDIEREAITARVEKAAAEIGSQASFWKQVGFGIVATAINTLILIVLAVGIRLAGIDVLDMVNNLGQSVTEAKPNGN